MQINCNHDGPEFGVVEEALEVLQTDPGTAEEALLGRVVTECDLHTVQRNVVEDDNRHHGQKNQKVELPVLQHVHDRVLLQQF